MTLVAQEGDSQEEGLFDALFDPWKLRLIEQAVQVRSGLDALLSELERAQVLHSNVINRIKDSISMPGESRVREFDRVYGIEATSRERGAPERTAGSTQTYGALSETPRSAAKS